MSGAEHKDVVGHKLAIVLVGRKHVGGYASLAGFGGEGANDVVGLESVDLKHGYVHGAYYLLDDRHRGTNVLRGFLSLRLVGRESLVAERLAVVESHADVGGLLFGENLVKGIDEAHNGRCVHALRVYTWVLYKRVVGAVDKRIGVEKK